MSKKYKKSYNLQDRIAKKVKSVDEKKVQPKHICINGIIMQISHPENWGNNAMTYVCEYCLKPKDTVKESKKHSTRCGWRHPPGNLIYE